MNWLNSSGEPPTKSEPISASRCVMSGNLSTLSISLFNLAMMYLGTAAGARTPYHAVASKFGTPDSLTVGTSGSSVERFALVIASARSLLLFTSAIRSSVDFTGSDGDTTSTKGTEATWITGAKSVAGSYGNLENSVTLIARGPLVPIRRV